VLSAKLFATLAILQLGLALLEGKTHLSVDIYVHATYFVIARFHLQILLALASGFFGLIYFAASRWVSHPLNNSLGLTHFVMATIGFVLLSVSLSEFRSAAASGSPSVQAMNHWPFLAATFGLLCLILGCAILAVNCGLTAIRVFQLRNG
jgi:heme/copper-type cytochrome/quinol oxidase subunit 1